MSKVQELGRDLCRKTDTQPNTRKGMDPYTSRFHHQTVSDWPQVVAVPGKKGLRE